MKKGFTLVELVVIIGIFGVLLSVGTDFLIQTIRNSNRSAMENEVRQNASRIMQDIESEAKKADPAIPFSFPVGGLQMTTIDVPSRVILYSVSNGDITKTVNGGTPATLNSNRVAVLNCTGCPGASCTSGLSTSLSGGSLLVNLTVQNNTTYTRSDFCAKTSLSETITARQY